MYFLNKEGFFKFLRYFVTSSVIAIAIYSSFMYTQGYLLRTVKAPPSLIVVQDVPTFIHDATSTIVNSVASSTISKRIISMLTIIDSVPKTGKFIVADLVTMKLSLYQDGVTTAEYHILTKGKPDTPYETPSGFYSILTKEIDHFNKSAKVHLPYSMQFYGNYFIHGWPYYIDNTPVSMSYSGGCIRLSTDDAARVYEFASRGIGIFVYDSTQTLVSSPLILGFIAVPTVSAESFLVADIDTGDVLLEQHADKSRTIASVAKLMTALVANETIMFDRKINISNSVLFHTADMTDNTAETEEQFFVGDLMYPLLMESNNAIADTISRYYGHREFVRWMNVTAQSLGMSSTRYADASGISPENISTADDLFRLAYYIAHKKSFIFKITRTQTKKLVAYNGDVFLLNNFNVFASSTNFVGGKVGNTTVAGDTMVSVFTIPVQGVQRRVAIIVLKSDDYTADTTKLIGWATQSVAQGSNIAQTSCTSCAVRTHYRKILQ